MTFFRIVTPSGCIVPKRFKDRGGAVRFAVSTYHRSKASLLHAGYRFVSAQTRTPKTAVAAQK
jgi:hypothetical protein